MQIYIVKAFANKANGGNPAAVVLNADRLDEQSMQSIAHEIGLSETSFVSQSDDADFKLDFFTPNMRIPHCGHATVATFHLLKEEGYINGKENLTKETVDGIRKITAKDDKIFMQQLAPIYWSTESKGVSHKEIYTSLNLTSDDMIGTAHIVNTGNNFLIIEVRSEEVIKTIKPDLEAIHAVSDKLDLIGYYVFTQTAEADATARMFGPRYAITEEAATGMAAGPLACYLYDVKRLRKEKYLIHQGYHMVPASPSTLYVNLKLDNKEQIQSLMVGGNAVVSSVIDLQALVSN